MRAVVLVLALCAGPLALTSCSSQSDEPFQVVATAEELMRGLFDPTAYIYWEAVGYSVSAEGVEITQPADDEEWQQVVDAALALADATNLLLLPGREMEKERGSDWNEFTLALREASIDAAEIARTQDVEDVLEAGGTIYEACLACHEQYLPEGSEALEF